LLSVTTPVILILFCCVVSELSMPFIGFSALPAFMSGEKHKEKNRTPIRAVVCTLFEVNKMFFIILILK
jgi:hypothetical protein